MSLLNLERTNAAVGLVLWLLLMLVHGPEPLSFDWPLVLIYLGSWVLIPFSRALMVVDFTAMESSQGKWIARLQMPAMICLAVANLAPEGFLRSALVLPWLGLTVLMAWQALCILRKETTDLARKISLFGWLQLPVGAAWLLADFSRFQPMGFDPQIVRLTAAHFHFAGFILPLLAGLLLARNDSRACRLAAVGSACGVALVASGITFTKLGYPLLLESIMAGGFCCFVLLLSICQAHYAFRIGSWWLGLSGTSLGVATAFALLYALRFWIPLPWLHIPRMWAVHGSLQVFGFAACGLVGWTRLLRTR
jgi:hypothetical protein